MPDYNELLNTMKKAATEAVEASKPVNVCFGKVTNDSPLQILVDQKMTLGSAQLVLTRNVTEFTTIEGTKQMTFHNQLEKGEEVILLRMQGGQKYIVLDRIGGG